MTMAGYQMNGLVPFNSINGIMPQLLTQPPYPQQNTALMPSIEKLAGKI